MKARRPSASKLDTALTCESSLTLPTSYVPDNPYSLAGRRKHVAMERTYLGARLIDSLAAVRPEERTEMTMLLEHRPRVEPIGISLPFIEVECWYYPLDGDAILGTPGEEQPDGWWRGREDSICRLVDWADKPIAVVDWKFGSPKNLPEPQNSGQLAYFACWLLNYPTTMAEVRAKGLVVAFYTRTGELVYRRLSPDALLAWEVRLADHEARLQLIDAGQAEPTLAKNPGCFYCASKPHCSLWNPTNASP